MDGEDMRPKVAPDGRDLSAAGSGEREEERYQSGWLAGWRMWGKPSVVAPRADAAADGDVRETQKRNGMPESG